MIAGDYEGLLQEGLQVVGELACNVELLLPFCYSSTWQLQCFAERLCPLLVEICDTSFGAI